MEKIIIWLNIPVLWATNTSGVKIIQQCDSYGCRKAVVLSQIHPADSKCFYSVTKSGHNYSSTKNLTPCLHRMPLCFSVISLPGEWQNFYIMNQATSAGDDTYQWTPTESQFLHIMPFFCCRHRWGTEAADAARLCRHDVTPSRHRLLSYSSTSAADSVLCRCQYVHSTTQVLCRSTPVCSSDVWSSRTKEEKQRKIDLWPPDTKSKHQLLLDIIISTLNVRYITSAGRGPSIKTKTKDICGGELWCGDWRLELRGKCTLLHEDLTERRGEKEEREPESVGTAGFAKPQCCAGAQWC